MTRRLPLSATALSAFFECQHHTWLDLGVARNERQRPGQNEIERLLLERRGRAHEARVLRHYQQLGLDVVQLSPAPAGDAAQRDAAAAATLAALHAGADVVYQGTLSDGDWTGRPDFLLKAPGPSRFGDHCYEVVDAKLARHAQARALIQLCVYTDQLAKLQGSVPERFWIAVGGSEEDTTAAPLELRSADYLAYYRRARARFEAFVTNEAQTPPYPEPVEFCDVCRWWKDCETRRREDDHPSLVAGITGRQRDRLACAGIRTTAQLGGLAPDRSIDGLDPGPLRRIREQARLQVAARSSERPLYELLQDSEPGAGLERLPEPTPGDLFLDLEGDAYALGTGLEYLFGLLELGSVGLDWSRRDKPGEPHYIRHFAQNRAEEKRAFEATLRRIEQGRLEFPNLHVFHFGHRESDALKKLSCRHASMEDKVDQLLREHVLVDLHAVVRQAVRASVEGYTLKQLEGLYGFERQTDPRAARGAMQLYGFWLETREAELDVDAQRALIERYNEEDCRSTWLLRGWLEERRSELTKTTGRKLARPSGESERASPKEQRSAEAAAVVELLQKGLPEDEAHDSPEAHARRVLAHLVSWHWRELKSAYWEYFHAKELPASERLEDRLVLDGLVYEDMIGEVAQSRVHRYRFPEQEHSIRRTPEPVDPDTGKSASVVDIGPSHVDIRRGKRSKEPHPRALIIGRPISYDTQEASLLAVAQAVAYHGFPDAAEPAELASARALLLRRPPRGATGPGGALLAPGEDTVAGVVRLALGLDGEVLGVQGPPGSGKTHRAAAAIVALIRAGKRVGVTANSHQVITSLMRKCITAARDDAAGTPLAAHHMHEPDAAEPDLPYTLGKDYPALREQLRSGALQLVGGTTFAWSRPELRGAVDVLVVDEAAQVALANVLAAAPAARNLILFGDPAQLEQPQRGVHPPGAGVSALEYLIGDERLTMPERLGVFLPETRRLHPALCAFTSQVFYENRLQALPGLAEQRLIGAGNWSGSGLCFVPVEHRGNTNRSDEEVDAVERIVGELLAGGASFHDARGGSRPLSPRDVLVVAPYNSQVAALRRRLLPGVPVGTVDRFQGQEAPVVIYSMTSSSGSEAPRGLEFLYSLNRLNVATSRAQARVILVASPDLASAKCRTPRQMRLVNALCTYLELASGATAPGAGTP
jgi:predicted RecB family nuclease